MKRYLVWGEYGHQDGDCLEKRKYRAHSADNAIKRYTREMRPQFPYFWKIQNVQVMVMELTQ